MDCLVCKGGRSLFDRGFRDSGIRLFRELVEMMAVFFTFRQNDFVEPETGFQERI